MSNTSQKAKLQRLLRRSILDADRGVPFRVDHPRRGTLSCERPKHGLIFLLLITFCFSGSELGGKIYQYDSTQPLTFFAMIAQAGMGIPTLSPGSLLRMRTCMRDRACSTSPRISGLVAETSRV